MDVNSSTGDEETATPFILGTDAIPEGDALEADDSAYIMQHALFLSISSVTIWGDERQRPPTTAYVVAGSQADRSENNTVSIVKLNSLHRTQIHGLFSSA